MSLQTIPRRALGLIALLAAVTATVTGAAGPPDPAAGASEPQQVVQRVSDGLMRVLREDRGRLETDPAYVHRLVDDLFLPNVDFDRVAGLVLGPFWRSADPEQREGFRREFKEMLIHTYASALNKLSEWEIRYPPMRLEPGQVDVAVPTEILRGGAPPVEVVYRMAFDGTRWRAYDVSVEGVSLLVNYRSTFVRLARQKGMDGLIRDLAERNATHGRGVGG
jgi:phospholipid transport system substrate-binding protein